MRDSEDFQQNSRSSGPPVEHPAALWSIFRSSHLKLWYAVTTWNVHESDERLVVLRTRRRATCIATQLPGAQTHFQPLVLWSVYEQQLLRHPQPRAVRNFPAPLFPSRTNYGLRPTCKSDTPQLVTFKSRQSGTKR